jgi:hypothetical protein
MFEYVMKVVQARSSRVKMIGEPISRLAGKVLQEVMVYEEDCLGFQRI